jgi:hypothetical protein
MRIYEIHKNAHSNDTCYIQKWLKLMSNLQVYHLTSNSLNTALTVKKLMCL